MSELGEAFVPIRATLDKLDGDLSQARGKVESALKGIGEKVTNIGKGLTTGLTAPIAGLTIGMAALAANAEPLIGLQQGFAAVTDRIGSSSEAMLSSLQDASGGLITNRDLMASFNKAAALVSDDFAETLPDSMSLVRRAAQATGQDMGFLFDSLVTGVGRVSPMILDNLGIQVSLAEVTERAAEMFGKSADELSKQEQQAALNQIVMEKLNQAYGDVPDVSMPFSQAKTAIANMKDEIGMALLPVMGSLIERFTPIISDILPKLVDAIEGVTSWFMNLSPPMQAVILAGIGLAAALGPVLIVVGQVITAVGAIIPVVTAVAGVLTFPLIAVIAAVIAIAAALVLAWKNNWGDIQGKTTAVIGWLQENISKAMQFIHDTIGRVLDAIRDWWSEHGDNVMATVDRFMNQAREDIDRIINIIKTVIETVTNAIQLIWSTFGAAILENAGNTWDLIKQAIETTLGIIGDIVDAFAAALQGDWETFGEELRSAAEDFWGLIEGIWDTALENIKNLVEPALNAISGWFEDARDTIEAAVQPALDVWNGFVSAVKNFWDWITTHVFSFKINLPKLPDWATPGSPLPIHTAWKDFAEEMSRMTIQPKFDLDRLVPVMALVGPNEPGSGTIINHEWNLEINEAGRVVDPVGSIALLKALSGVG